MAERSFRIFISSPGDVGEERVIAGRVIERLAGEFGQFLDIEPVLWEHEPLRATGHFQEQIVLPSKTEVVVCILWSRLGTRLPEGFTREDGTTYDSGTEWEFEDAARSFREKGTPDLLVYRKTREALIALSGEAAVLERLRQKKALDIFIEHWFGNPDESFKAAFHAFETTDKFEDLLETHLRKLIAEQLPEHLTADEGDATRISWHAGSPFRGLEAFGFEHAPVFFGRTRAVGEVKQAIEAQAARGVAFLTIFGMSGSGKSSLLRAGLLPTICQPGVVERIGLWRWCTWRPSDTAADLFDGLAQALMGEAALPELAAAKWDRARLAEQFRSAPKLAAQPIEQALAIASEDGGLTAGAESRLALVIDQMEELFTLERVDEAERTAFIGVLASLARSGQVWVIGAMRSDFYHRCAEAPELVALSEGAGQYHLVPPSPAESAQIIRNPARAAGLRFEVAAATGERLDDVLHAAAVRDPAALPLLEFTLEELFKLRSDDGVLTFESYELLGGLEGALARRAEEAFGKLEAPVQEALPSVLRALVTVGTDEEEPVAARRVPLGAVATTQERKSLVDAFIEARLLVTDRADDGTAVVRLTHEALLYHWPRLQEWLEEDRDFLRTRARVAAAAARWYREAEAPDLLLPEGKPLAEAEALLHRRDELDQELAAFIDDSIAAYRNRLEAAKATDRRRLRVAAATAVVLGLLAIGAGVAGYIAVEKSIEAEDQRVIADAAARQAISERNKALRTQSLFLADLSRQHTATGDAATGIRLALEGLPANLSNPDRPYVAAAESALYRALSVHRERRVLRAHKDRVWHAVFSPDGKRIATASSDNTARVWNTETGAESLVLSGHEGNVLHVEFDPEGRRVATASADGTVRLWDAGSGNALAVLSGHSAPVFSAKFSSDGRRIVSASADKTARLWDAESGLEIGVLRGHRDKVLYAAFSPDDRYVVTASYDGTAIVWDAESGALLTTLRGHENKVVFAEFRPDGQMIVTASLDKTARLWNASTGLEIAVLRGHREAVGHAEFSPNGRFVVTASADGDARIWDVDTGKTISVLNGHDALVQHAEFSPDGRRILTVSQDATARIWDAETGAELAVLRGHGGKIWHGSFSPDGRQIVTASLDGTARLWDAANNMELAVYESHTEAVWQASFSPDGDRVVTSSLDGSARVWDVETGAERFAMSNHSASIWHAEFSDDSSFIVTASADGTARLWDSQTGSERAVLRGHRGAVLYAAISPGGQWVATGSQDSTARIWDAQTGEQVAVLRGHDGAVGHLAFNADGSLLATASGDGTARLWDVETGTERSVLRGHRLAVVWVEFSPAGDRMVTVSLDGTARLWNSRNGSELSVLRSEFDLLGRAAFSADGRLIVTPLWDGSIVVWDTDTGDEVTRFRGHEDSVLSVKFSPDGRRLVSASADNTARLWDLESGAELAVLRGHTDKVVWAEFSNNGQKIVTASYDGTARLWQVFPQGQKLIEFAKSVAPRRLTAKQRRRFFLSAE